MLRSSVGSGLAQGFRGKGLGWISLRKKERSYLKSELSPEKVAKCGGVQGGSTGQQTSVPGNRDMKHLDPV